METVCAWVRRPFRTGTFIRRNQTLRVWLISIVASRLARAGAAQCPYLWPDHSAPGLPGEHRLMVASSGW
jgi:hypothetical protein